MKRNPKNQSCKPVKLTKKQANIYIWGWQKESRFRDAVCGRRFGKTYLGKAEIKRAARLIQKCDVDVDNEVWYAAPTFKQAKRVFWRRLKQSIPSKWRAGRPNETECSITLKSGHVIRIVGLNDYDNLRGSGLFFLIIDEWADCPYEAWEEVLRPMLSTCKYTIDGITNVGGHVLRIGTPKGYNHFYDTYRAGQPGGEPDHKSWHYTSSQGGNIPEEEIAAAKRTLDPKTFKQEYEGSFETFRGLVFYCFDRNLNASAEAIKSTEDLHIGMDFNVEKMAAVVFIIKNNNMIAVGEFYNLFDTPAMINAIKNRYGDKHKIYVYPDASGRNRKSTNASESDISLLKQAGFFIKVNRTNPAVKDRINAANARLSNANGERFLFVNVANCKKLTESLEKHIYSENGEPDKKQGFDHMTDAFSYPVAYLYPIQSREINTAPLIL